MQKQKTTFLAALFALAGLTGCTTDPTQPALAGGSISVNAGDLQFGVTGTDVTLAPSVVVRDKSGVGVEGVTVMFVPSMGGGSVTGQQATTDANGVASVGSWKLGSSPVENRLTASTPGIPLEAAIVRANALSPGFNVDSLVAGAAHTCAIDPASAAYCWGTNTQGALGDGTYASRLAPVAVTSALSFRVLAAGSHTCGLLGSGVAYCWGLNSDGQVGDGSVGGNPNVPRRVAGTVTFQSIVAGNAHTCALTSTGRAYCWGDNSAGALGDGTFTDRSTPTPVATSLVFQSISAAGGFHTCAVTAAGAAYCWGANGEGQLGDGTQTNRNVPVPVSGGRTFSAIFAGYHTCAVTSAGAAFCWGGNASGQTGDGTTTRRPSPVAVSGALVFRDLAIGIGHTCGVTTTGVAWCWGLNDRGQLGNGTLANRSTPGVAAPGLRFKAMAASRHTCGVTVASGAYCWGENSAGSLGTGNSFSSASPVPVARP